MLVHQGFAATISALLLTAGGAVASPLNTVAERPAAEKPAVLEGVGIQEKLGAQLDLGLKFKDENGADVTLGQFFDGKTPVILSPVYYSCPGLCNFHLNGLTEGLKGLPWSAGGKFNVVAVSFDARETHTVAAAKKATYMKLYDRPGTENGWHFLTGDKENVEKLMTSLGFSFRWNEQEGEWAHASAAIVASPTGMLSRYLPGIMFEPNDIKLAVVEAGQGKVGTLLDQLVLYCFQYNPHQSRYTVYAMNMVKLGGLLMMVLLGLWLLPFWLRHRRRAGEARSS